MALKCKFHCTENSPTEYCDSSERKTISAKMYESFREIQPIYPLCGWFFLWLFETDGFIDIKTMKNHFLRKKKISPPFFQPKKKVVH